MIISKLAFLQLMKNKKRTIITLFSIILSIAMITSIIMFYKSADNFLLQNVKTNKDNLYITADNVKKYNTQGLLFSSCGIIEIIIILSAVLVIANAFAISANERIQQFGILKSIGATKEQIGRTVLIEAFILAVFAIPFGILMGFIIEKIAIEIINYLLYEMLNTVSGNKGGKLHMVFSLSAIFYAVFLSFFTIVISAWIPAKKASKISAVDAIKLTKEIKIKSKKIKTSKFIQKVLGIEGALAVKSLKRNSSKYRITAISLITSIVMFIGGFSFSENFDKVTNMRFSNDKDDINVQISLGGENKILLKTIADQITQIKTKETKTWVAYTTIHKFDNFNQNIIKSNKINRIQIHSLKKEYYNQLCSELSIEKNGMLPDSGILINTEDTIDLVNFTKNLVINFGDKNQYSLTLLDKVDYIPKGVVPLFGNDTINLMIPEDMLHLYFKEENKMMAMISVSTKKSKDFCEKSYKIINSLKDKNITYKIYNSEKQWEQEYNVSLLTRFFIMGFACILSLIAVTNLISMFSASIVLRKREFAMLWSVGMSQKDLYKMLNYESFLYAIGTLIFGVPIGTLVSWFIYISFPDTFTFGYIFPWKGILICIIVVLLLIFGTIRYSINKIKKLNISETVKMEII